MRIRLTVLMMAAMVLAACQGERATVTGQYGAGVVSGQVVMADGSSPAGVQVSIGGTGLSMIVGADGAFAFAGAPVDAELTFERGSDAVFAKLRLGENAGAVVIELAQTHAKKGTSKRRGASRGNPVTEFEGVIRTASATEIVVFTSKGVEQAIVLAADTMIRKGNTPVAPAELLPETRVHVKARKTETGFTAILVIVQNAKGGDDDDDDSERPEGKEYEGTVVSASATQLVLLAKGVEQTFLLSATTDIRKGNTPVAAADIQPGWRVHVKATTGADGTKTANRVIVQNTGSGDDDGDDDSGKVKFGGRVTAVSATGLTVETDSGSVSVTTDAATRIEKKGSAILLTAIVTGDRVKVEGTAAGENVVLARKIEVK
jgi:hypothetical protein